MKVLVAEDNELKLKSILDFLESSHGIKSDLVKVVLTPDDAIVEIKKKIYDFFILDMSLPAFEQDKKQIRSLSGKRVLMTMKHKRLKTRTVVFTQWDVFGHHDDRVSLENLKTELLDTFPSFLKDIIFWESSSNEWKVRISSQINEL
ncbi:response regulator [Pseudoalteromonas lipolytica]|uniref:Histidine kinase n=1 Tax=Pseudoalteromonas lipolytica TaxID=570156 RepID=A0A0P7E670_9GAMM|nr:response regulator [Pseudoalteromonas lipolytica]KPM85163.1 histidine kinase [Pseudoalteromonas lipolytica]